MLTNVFHLLDYAIACRPYLGCFYKNFIDDDRILQEQLDLHLQVFTVGQIKITTVSFSNLSPQVALIA